VEKGTNAVQFPFEKARISLGTRLVQDADLFLPVWPRVSSTGPPLLQRCLSVRLRAEVRRLHDHQRKRASDPSRERVTVTIFEGLPA
jgi:hypothetical protein